MTTIYLVRHAEAEGNVFRRMHGHYDSLITPNGYRQIAALEKRFAEIPVDACYASDLIRTCLTARAVYIPKCLPLQRDARFREVNVGVWEDVPFGELGYRAKEQLALFNQAPDRWQVEGGETFWQCTDRFLAGLAAAVNANEGKTIAIFSHGAILRCVQARLFYSLDTINEISHCENTGVSKLHYDAGKYTAVFLNDSAHLTEDLSTLGRQRWWRSGGKEDCNLWFRLAEASEVETFFSHYGSGKTSFDAEKTMNFLGFVGDEMAGMVCFGKRDAVTAELHHLQIIPAWQGLELEAQLLGCAVSSCRRAGCSVLRTKLLPMDESVKKFYLRFGFQEVGSQGEMEMNIDTTRFSWNDSKK